MGSRAPDLKLINSGFGSSDCVGLHWRLGSIIVSHEVLKHIGISTNYIVYHSLLDERDGPVSAGYVSLVSRRHLTNT